MKNPHDLKAGQELYLVPSRNRGNPRRVVIEKVGRVWATLAGYGEGRIDMDTLLVDGGDYSSPGVCYLSEEDYLKQKAKSRLWEKIQREVSNTYRPKIGYESMMIIADNLGINTSD